MRRTPTVGTGPRRARARGTEHPHARIALLGGTAAALAVSAACTAGPGPVPLATVTRADVVEIVDASATVTARAVATLTAPADGTLVAFPVPAGGRVSAGQVVAIIDSPTARQRLQDAGDALAALEGGAVSTDPGNLTVLVDRTDRSAAEAFATAREAAAAVADPAVRQALLHQVAAAEAGYRAAAGTARAVLDSVREGLAGIGEAMNALTAAQRVQARSAYQLARSTVDALVLRAPSDGVVQPGGSSGQPAGLGGLSDLLAGAGGVAVPGSAAAGGGQAGGPGLDPAPALGARVGAGTAVATVVDTGELGLLAEVDETDVLLVTPGTVARVELDAVPGASYPATVRAVDVLPTASARGGVSYRVRLSLGPGAGPDEPTPGAAEGGSGAAAPRPLPGMSAVAHLEVRRAPGAIAVPAAAVFTSDGHDAVWLARDGRATRVRVRLGVQGAARVEVVSGLAPGDRVVARGTDRIRSGQRLP